MANESTVVVTRTPGFSLRPFLLLVGIAGAVAALWVDFGTLHRLHNGDSLLPVLVSLQYWTPFQWELDAAPLP